MTRARSSTTHTAREPREVEAARRKAAPPEPPCVAGVVANANAGWLQWLAGLRG